jgi:hypothetical protein
MKIQNASRTTTTQSVLLRSNPNLENTASLQWIERHAVVFLYYSKYFSAMVLCKVLCQSGETKVLCRLVDIDIMPRLKLLGCLDRKTAATSQLPTR